MSQLKEGRDPAINGFGASKSNRQKFVAYIFPSVKISRIKSLNLRFDFFERGSKYDNYRNNWELISR